MKTTLTTFVLVCLTALPASADCPARGDGITVEGDRVRVEGAIVFDLYRGAIEPSTMHTIDAVARRLVACPELTIEIQVHTDTRRAGAFNARGSATIAARIRDRLIERGVAASRIAACGYGESRPLTGDMEPWDPRQNRVEWVRITHATTHVCPSLE